MGVKSLPHDDSGKLIYSGQEMKVANIAVSAGAWTAITLPTDCKYLVLKMRGGGYFKLSDDSAGTNYITLVQLAVEIAKQKAGDVLCYVQPDVDDTAELLLVR